MSALGVGHVDPNVLHAHPNTLVTIAWLLYAPRSTAALTGTDLEARLDCTSQGDHEGTLLLASCSPLTTGSPIAGLLGDDVARQLRDSGAIGDFGYHFLTKTGREVAWNAPANSSLLSTNRFHEIMADPKSRVVMIAGGTDKLPIMHAALKARLCDSLITDRQTAQELS